MKNKILNYLGIALRGGSLILGTDAVCNNLAKKIKLVIVASDASSATIDKLEKKSYFYQIPFINNLTSLELDQALGRQNIKVIGLTSEGIANQIINLDKEGENYESK